MGGGDLNLKKSWHTQTLHNIEKVWKAEQRAEDEKKKMDQLRRELTEERQLAEMQEIQEKAGLVKKKSDRLDWMYATSAQASSEVQEEYLLGKRRVDTPGNQTAGVAVVPDSMSAPNAAEKGDRDAMTKVREDPMLMIKRREQMSLKEILDNPLRMKQLRELNEKHKKDKKTKKDKKAKKDKKKHHHHSSSSGGGGGSSTAPTAAAKDDSDDDSDSDDDDAAKHKLAKEDKVQNGDHRDDRRDDRGRNGERNHARDLDRDLDRDQRRDRDVDRDRNRDREHRDRDLKRDREDDRGRYDDRDRQRDQGDRDRYGGTRSNGFRSSNSSSLAKRPVMTAEEREAKLAAMKNDAAWNATVRNQKLEEDIRKEDEEAARLAAKRGRQDDDAEFLQDIKKNTYTSNEAVNLAERVQRNRHYVQKTDDESGKSFLSRN